MDAFTRHIDRKMRRRCMDWALVNGRKELLVAGKVNCFIRNASFDPVARPGCLDRWFQGKDTAALSIREAFGALEPFIPAIATATRASRSWMRRAWRPRSFFRRSGSAWRRR